MKRHVSLKFLLAAVLAATLPVAQAAPKRPLTHRDYDSWKAISSQTLSRDGKFLAYGQFPQEGDGQVVIRNLATGKELREDAGTPPPLRENSDSEAPPPESSGAALRVGFTHDGKFAVASFFPAKADTDKAAKDHKRPEEMPKGGLILFDLAAWSATRLPDVASFQIPENGESFVAYLKTPKNAPPPPATAPAAPGRRPQYGSDLVLRDLRAAAGKEAAFEDVTEYSISKDGKTLAYAVSSRKEETNGIYTVATTGGAAPVALLQGKGHYVRFTWDAGQHRAAFLSDRDDTSGKPAKFKAYVWERGQAAPTEVVSSSTPGFKPDYAVADRGAVRFSRDGSRLFLSCAPAADVAAPEPTPAAATPAIPADKAVADLWNWKDDYVQPMQKARSAQDRSRTYTAIWNLAAGKFVQLADSTMQAVTASDDGAIALGTDDRAYRHMVDYDGSYNDTYFIDTATGDRKLLLKKQRGGGGGGRGASPLAPDGKHLLAFHDKQWWSVQLPDGKAVDLTGKLAPRFFNEDQDTPDEPGAYGAGGWTRDGKWAFLYDHYDVWAVAPDGSAARRLTDGRASSLQFRIQPLEVPGDDEPPGIDPAKPLFLRAESLETRESGFYSLASLDRGQPRRLIWGPRTIAP